VLGRLRLVRGLDSRRVDLSQRPSKGSSHAGAQTHAGDRGLRFLVHPWLPSRVGSRTGDRDPLQVGSDGEAVCIHVWVVSHGTTFNG
jgi:hypothetical protein